MADDTTTVPAGPVTSVPIPTINLDTKPQPREQKPFLAVVVADEPAVFVNDGGETIVKWHYAMRPVDYRIGGKTGSWHASVPMKDGEGTPCMRAATSFGAAFGSKKEDGTTRGIAKGDLLGLVGYFKRVDIFFKDKTEPWTYYIATQNGTPEDYARALALPPHVPDMPTGETVESAPRVVDTNFTEDQINRLLGLYEGKSPVEAVRSLMQNVDGLTDLADAIKSGAALDTLINLGAISLVDGRAVRV